MNTAPSSAATNASGRKCPAPSASEVPTSTGATAAGSVRTRAAITQMRSALTLLGPLGEAREVRLALLAGTRRVPPGPPRCRRTAGSRRARAAGFPTSPSSAALKLAFSSRSANGESASISRHHATVSSSRRSSGTTVLTIPISRASSAEYCRHRNQISLAFFGPTRFASRPAPKPPSNEPTFGPTCPKRALSAAIVRSHTRCSTWPPPIA